MSPSQGFRLHERDRGPQAEAEGDFRSGSDNHDRVKVRVTCNGAQQPQFSVESERGDD